MCWRWTPCLKKIILHERDFSQTTIDSLPGLFYLFDQHGRFLRLNRNFEKVSGYSAEELSGMTPIDLFDGADKERITAAIRQVFLKGEVTVEADFLSKDKTRTPYFFTGKLFLYEGKSCVIGAGLDITKHNQLEAQFRQSQKMETIGHLAGGVAHDLNNILAAMFLQIGLIKMSGQLPAGVRDGLTNLRLDADRAANLVRQLLLFARRSVMQMRDLDLNETINSFSMMLRRIIGEDIQLQLQLHSAPLHLHADPGMIEQVLMNLAVNSRDAMPKGGKLIVETTAATLNTSAAERLGAEAGPGDYVCLSVCDTGPGSPPEAFPQIFEPFFTTKDIGKGTGLGLASVFGIVKQHKGCIELDNRPGQGVTFRIYLPALATPVIKTGSAVVQPAILRGKETILWVEDDNTLRNLTSRALEQHGYKVLEAASGVEAMDLWRKNRDTVNLLITDLLLPGGLSGLELSKCLRAEKPGLKVVYVSGYSLDAIEGGLELGAGRNFIQKPFPPDQLLRTLRQTLDA